MLAASRFPNDSTNLGRYQLLSELGSGGMAKVHLARVVGEGGFERLVAIKILHEHLAREEAFVAMFLDEARLAARIRHPNVVSTIDIQSARGTRFLVMDYVEGHALNHVLRRIEGSRVPLEVALRIQLDMLAGLHAAHELTDEGGKGLLLVHRDVSPHNILVGKDGMARITDFGIARAESRLSSTASGEFKGKVPYMAPEQIVGEEVDRRLDVYAAGLVLWEMLVGRRLVSGDNNANVMRRILLGVYTPPSAENTEIPEPIERVIERSLQRVPDDRYASALDFAEALEEAAMAAGVRVATARAVAAFLAKIPQPSAAKPANDSDSLPEGRGSGVATKISVDFEPRVQGETIAGLSSASASGGSVGPRWSIYFGGALVLGVAIGLVALGVDAGANQQGTPAMSALSVGTSSASPPPETLASTMPSSATMPSMQPNVTPTPSATPSAKPQRLIPGRGVKTTPSAKTSPKTSPSGYLPGGL